MLDNFFKFSARNTDIKTEFVAGLTTFFAMSYILGVNPDLLANANMPLNGVYFSTALATAISCIIMGLLSNYPLGIAPGMGVNALFAITVVKTMGYSWKAALAAVLLTTILFFIITISGLRIKIIKAIPDVLHLAMGAGIGFFLAFIGIKNAGIIISNSTNIVGLSSLTSPAPLLALLGIVITLILYIRKIPGSIFLGLLITSIIGLIFTSIGFGVNSPIQMPTIPSHYIFLNFDTSTVFAFISGFKELFSGNINQLIMVIFSFIFFIFFDTTGTFIVLGKQGDFPKDEKGEYEGTDKGFLGIAISNIIGVILGTSPLITYIESSAGVGAGGRTGLSTIFTGIFFLISMIFAPTILSLFTPSVTAAALVVVGILMIGQLKEIDWDDFISLATVFTTINMMLLTSSIILGIAFGFIIYTITSIASGKAKELHKIGWILTIVFIYYILFGIK
ncbi:NCS2 family permease [uncultured Methanobrevibacter sp.]|uniref:NCS2 family permease n=1 Tax=uncultured Methanobrevibacter sp. TaxID=253161 RepID=UPI0025CF2187|nr:NCS2 family permease [uncultured Methanobrevibacter sp.]